MRRLDGRPFDLSGRPGWARQHQGALRHPRSIPFFLRSLGDVAASGLGLPNRFETRAEPDLPGALLGEERSLLVVRG